ncbi:hypothetical protein Q5741_13085 [Paenibacillus sp. JX-17]|uniref:MFS transporter n=1 Tax=Paenibacillus lacisoli TaxID=3064525 RepID=A0ABT9CDJ6_9BACL|nr:hypothetical protein [Paenibacillus sp. JX-17]MDO7907340.1 hypothetical protein [Paenibacillus sp. JX-17]
MQGPSWLRQIRPDQETLLGWLISAIGVGSVLMIAVLNCFKSLSPEKGLGGECIYIGAGMGLLGCTQAGSAVWPILFLGGSIGIGNGLYMVTYNYMLQTETPLHLTGRVFSIQNMMMSCVMLIAPLLGGAADFPLWSKRRVLAGGAGHWRNWTGRPFLWSQDVARSKSV